jgi:hypothetical protein
MGMQLDLKEYPIGPRIIIEKSSSCARPLEEGVFRLQLKRVRIPILSLLLIGFSLFLKNAVGELGFGSRIPSGKIDLCGVTLSKSAAHKKVSDSHPASSPSRVPTYEEIAPDLRRAQENWNAPFFTDPAQHVPRHWAYLVHAVPENSRTALSADGFGTETLVPRGSNPALADIELFKQPGRIDEKTFVSASVISHNDDGPPELNKTQTYSATGFILGFKPSNVIAGAAFDMATDHTLLGPLSPSEVLQKVAQYFVFGGRNRGGGLPSPTEIVRNTRGYIHSEVVLLGQSPAGDNLACTGIFVRTDSRGRPLATETRVLEIEELHRRTGLPIIKIPIEDAGDFKDMPPTFTTFSDRVNPIIVLQKDGVRHQLEFVPPNAEGGPTWNYTTYSNGKAVTSRAYFRDCLSELRKEAPSNERLYGLLKAVHLLQ